MSWFMITFVGENNMWNRAQRGEFWVPGHECWVLTLLLLLLHARLKSTLTVDLGRIALLCYYKLHLYVFSDISYQCTICTQNYQTHQITTVYCVHYYVKKSIKSCNLSPRWSKLLDVFFQTSMFEKNKIGMHVYNHFIIYKSPASPACLVKSSLVMDGLSVAWFCL